MSIFERHPGDEGTRHEVAGASTALEVRGRSARTELWEVLRELHSFPRADIGSRDFSNRIPVRIALLQRIELLLKEWRSELEEREKSR
jgi:hypothetical protein